ncbi:aspartate:alanine exchanger family transporter [Miltoncostaea marina]|uniref:aspartate:alanine exchanger family transporter n=1 Tax=Miltoncostaea marina TaxID=2843215 RepID=UPI001C3D3091|nr:TrkA C-terminal domain-containing protein [Miltoncostaea marina]
MPPPPEERPIASVADLLADNTLLLLFLCLAAGSAAGMAAWHGYMLGPAAVLFTALALSAWDERLVLPPVLGQFGLAVFAYCVGAGSGSAFFGALRTSLRLILGVGAVLAGLAAVTWAVGDVLGLRQGVIAGVYAGALTNTPALAAATEELDGAAGPTVGYSVTYTGGVVLMLLAAAWALRAREREAAGDDDLPDPIMNATVLVTREGLPPLAELGHGAVVFSRIHRDGELSVPSPDTRLRAGDMVAVIGRPADVTALAEGIGRPAPDHLPLDRHQLDMRRMTISSRGLSGLTVAQLGLGHFGAVASRVRRGDVDLLATHDLVVQQGDRIRVIAPRERLAQVARHLGDSERGPADLNAVGLALGLTLGILLGLVPLPSPVGGTFEIGLAAGPLVAGLVLGRQIRSGPIVWAVPYTASIVLQQLGLLIFLAYAGSNAGGALADALGGTEWLRILALGTLVTALAAGGLLVVTRRLGVHGPRLAGVIAGAQTQPAVLAFAQERSPDQRVGLGYALIVPAAMIVKILAAQMIVLV